MEVLLKKTKITASILSQTLRSTEDDLKKSNVLGWCKYRQLTFIIFYKEDKNTLSMFPMFKDLVFEDRQKEIHGSDNYALVVKIGGNYTPTTYVFKTEKEREDFRMLLKVLKNIAEDAGQFYI